MQDYSYLNFSSNQMIEILKEYYGCEKVNIEILKSKIYDSDGDPCGYKYEPIVTLTYKFKFKNINVEGKREEYLKNENLIEIFKNLVGDDFEILTAYAHEKEFVAIIREKSKELKLTK